MKTISFSEAQANFELRRIEQKIEDMFGEPENETEIDVSGYDYDPQYDDEVCPMFYDGN